MVTFKKIGFILLLLISVFVIDSASSHGWSEYPKARQAICHDQGGVWSGSPPNEACAQAKSESGTYPFVQKNEFSTIVLDFNNIEEVEAAVPKGTLCYANDPAKSGMGNTSPDWTRTEMTSGPFEFVFNATAPHNPSFWKFYLTKPGHVISTEFGWENLNLIAEYGNIPVEDGKYRMQVTLPEDQSGDAILLVRWQRDDAAGEGFYNCSDITLVDEIGGEQGDDEGEEPMEPEPYLIEGDQYIPASFDLEAVQTGDTVRYTVSNDLGALHSQLSVLVTEENIDYWPRLLASEVNGYYADTLTPDSKVFIGAWHEEMGHYMYFKDDLNANFFNTKTAGFSGELALLKADDEEGGSSVGLVIIPKVLIGLEPTEVHFGEKLYLEVEQVETKLDTVLWTQTSGPLVETFEDGDTLVVNTNSLLETDIPAELIFAVSGTLDEVSYEGVIAVAVGEVKTADSEPGTGEPGVPGSDDPEVPGSDDPEGSGSDDQGEGTGSDDQGGSGSDDQGGSGSDDQEGSGSDDQEGSGSDDQEGTGSDDQEGTGSDDPEGTGSDDPEGTGSDDQEGTGSDDQEGSGSDDPEGTGPDDQGGTGPDDQGGSESDPEGSEFVPGTAYQVGQRVTHLGNLYICLVPGWCSNTAANWAYEPGVGLYWKQAWMLVSEPNDVEPNPKEAADCDDWESSKVYGKDDIAIYNQTQWKAKWWTRGEKPGSTGRWGVWQNLGPYSCPS